MYVYVYVFVWRASAWGSVANDLTPNCLLTPHWVVTTNCEAALGGDAELLTPH